MDAERQHGRRELRRVGRITLMQTMVMSYSNGGIGTEPYRRKSSSNRHPISAHRSYDEGHMRRNRRRSPISLCPPLQRVLGRL
jgi:hypothetical protein